MFEFPLIRFDNRKWLEKLQEGEFFMRNSLYYQRLENDDKARSDHFDGSIPFPDKNGVMEKISGRRTENQRLMLFNRFVKCFLHCDKSMVQKIGESLWKIVFPEETKKEIRDFKVDSALVVFSPTTFIEQVKSACEANQERVWCDDVLYLNTADYQRKTKLLFENPQKVYEVPFCKDIRFMNQKEFRVCVQHPFAGIDRKKKFLDLPAEIAEESYSLNIGPIVDSCIISIDNLLKNGILYDPSISHYYISEENDDA